MKPIRELADGAACCLRMLRIGCLIYDNCAENTIGCSKSFLLK